MVQLFRRLRKQLSQFCTTHVIIKSWAESRLSEKQARMAAHDYSAYPQYMCISQQRARTGLLVRGECLRVLDSELDQQITLFRGEVVVRHALFLDLHDVLCTCRPRISDGAIGTDFAGVLGRGLVGDKRSTA